MRAFHMLGAAMRSRNGTEKPWTVGETRTVERPHAIAICSHGYHSCPELGGLRDYLYGPMLCVVDVSEPVATRDTKQVSASRTLIAAFDVSRQLREFACACATRALDRIEARGGEIDPRSRAAIDVARQYARGDASKAALETAYGAAERAAAAAAFTAHAAAHAAAAFTAYAAHAAAVGAHAAAVAAAVAAADGAQETEITWQREHLAKLLGPVVAVVAS